jgi:ABC-2 type transport system permease protein
MLSNVARVACLELVLSLRIPASVTYVFMLPALLLLLFGNRYSRVGVLVTGLTALVTGISTLQGVGQVTATMRHGIWKTIRVSLHPEWLYLAGVVASRVVRTLLVAAMLLACAWVGFGYSIQGSVAGHFALVVLGSATFAALGLLLAYLPAAPATASTVMNVTIMLMLALSGIFAPPSGVLQTLSHLSPLSYLTVLLRANAGEATITAAQAAGSTAVLLAWAAAAGWLAYRLARVREDD